MNQKWFEFAAKQGATIDNDQVVAWGNSEPSAYSVDRTCICDLSPLGVIRASGEEAQSFLHGQFTNDLGQVTPTTGQLSSYCNPKGRVLSIFHIYQEDDSYCLVLPRDVIEATINKLNMFRLMAKVDMSDESDERVLFGIAGGDTESVLGDLDIVVPKEINCCIQDKEITLIRLPSESTRVLLVSSADAAIPVWEQLSARLPIATSGLWDLHDIHSGIPKVIAGTSETFIPQMVNLELIDGVNFSKGCYPGQEVVARTHYLGKPNRRMYRVHVADANAPEPGTNIFSPEDETQPVGKIVTAQKISSGTSALAVLRTEKKDDENLHLGSVTGPKISVQSLPYSMETKPE